MKIEDYVFSDDLILRTPAYPTDFYDITLQHMLTDEHFRDAMRHVAPVVYEELQKIGFDALRLSPKLKFTIFKYFNRMCFRPTPLGTMAAISHVRFGSSSGMILAQNIILHILPSFRNNILQGAVLLHERMAEDIPFESNKSIYPNGDELRYLRYRADEKEMRREFYIESAATTPAILQVLQQASRPVIKRSLIRYVIEAHAVTDSEAAAFVEELISNQLLICSFDPNITGTEYLQRIQHLTGTPRTAPLTAVPGSTSNYFINAERNVIAGTADVAIQEKLTDGLHFIDRLTAYSELPQLTSFKERFTKKFDRQAVSLLRAMDPELGVGYEHLAVSAEKPVLLEQVNFHTEEQHMTHSPGEASQLLLRLWHKTQESGKDTISLSHEDVGQLKRDTDKYELPPSMSVLYRTTEDKVFIESAGNASATSLAGRFSIVNEYIHAGIKHIAQQEERNNPGVVFAEVAHYSNLHTANIERRNHFYTYEIPVRTTSCLDPEQQITLDDLYVFMAGSEIILYSRRLNKRVIPRLSSAFNYQRSDVPVFRFLCDLQHQKLKSAMSFDLAAFIPGLRHYPRVETPHSILSLASWRISKEEVVMIADLSLEERTVALLQLTARLNLPDKFCVTQGDNQILIDLETPTGTEMLCSFFEERKELHIKEYPFLPHGEAAIRDEKGHAYVGQYITSLIKPKRTYLPTARPYFPHAFNDVARSFAPGTSWLYFKIYCQPVHANVILTHLYQSFIKTLLEENKLNCFFFVRYSEDGTHLRLRFNAVYEVLQEVQLQMRKHLQPYINNGYVARLQLDTYERELERYHGQLIEHVEKVFMGSSIYVFEHLEGMPDYTNAFMGTLSLFDSFCYTTKDREVFCEAMYRSFSKEFKATGQMEQQLRDTYRRLSKIFRQTALSFETAGSLLSIASFHLVEAATALTVEEQQQLLTDLIHMHVNRCFNEQPRQQEWVLYFCMWRYHLSISHH